MSVEGIDVRAGAEGDHVRLEAVDDGARLFAGAVVRLLEVDVLAGLLFPVFGKGRVILLVKLASGIVGNVEERRRIRGLEPGGGERQGA
jgi:hypothetical protein